tara:strand:- start:1030 stop:1185 length:156 start_codon:yes stop_codon:yes gene_type:complete
MSEPFDILKTWAINGTVFAVTMSDIETILSILLLVLSIVYTVYKLIKLRAD